MDLFNNKRLFTNNKGDFGYKSPHKQQILFSLQVFHSITAPLSPIEPHWAPLSPIKP